MAANSVIKLSELEGAKRIDAEYYQHKYLKNRLAITKIPHVTIGKIAERCKKGIFDIKAESYTHSGIPFIRISNLKNGLVDDDNMAFIPSDINQKEIKTEFHKGDIVLSKTAYPAASIVFFDKCNISQDIIGVSLSGSWKTKLLAPYLVAFLNSNYGLLEMQQWFQGNIQMHLALPDVRRIIIPILSLEFQEKISSLYSEAQQELKKSKSFHSKAENLLFEELELKDFKPKYELSYAANFSNVLRAHRFDAEYFQPLYEKMIDYIRGKGHHTIGEIQEFNMRGTQPTYVENGPVRVVTSKRLGKISIDYENLEKTSLETWNENNHARIKQYDILIYTTGAYVGRTNCFLENYEVLASNHVNILRIRKMNPIYVSVYLNSFLGQMQVRRYISGSAQAELYPSNISEFIIWDAPEETQQKIAELIQQCYEARKRTIELMEKAKRRVEEAIEKIS